MTGELLWVVAGALVASDGRCLMHCRPLEKHHGGLWEFPGGKVEPYELPAESLVRELHEELGITVQAEMCEPIGFAEKHESTDSPAIVILLYKIAEWAGEPKALEGGGIGWFTPAEVDSLDKPPLDERLAPQLFEKM